MIGSRIWISLLFFCFSRAFWRNPNRANWTLERETGNGVTGRTTVGGCGVGWGRFSLWRCARRHGDKRKKKMEMRKPQPLDLMTQDCTQNEIKNPRSNTTAVGWDCAKQERECQGFVGFIVDEMEREREGRNLKGSTGPGLCDAMKICENFILI